ncbi:MAG: group 1 truncated hemoglobin [Pseudomonadales bacterium]
MIETLFDKYGGFTTFSALVTNFYQKVLDSDQLAPYFEGVDMDSLMTHQTNFLAKALGGPDKYDGRDLVKAHARFNISLLNFQEVVELLEESLEEGGVESEDINTIISLVNNLQSQIVND